MDSAVSLPGIRRLKITLVAGIALLTTDALFAQSTDQNGVDSLKTQMSQMQRQYEQRIEAMEANMKALESNANSGSILNARVLTDADGKEVAGKAPAPMLDESFLKSLTRTSRFLSTSDPASASMGTAVRKTLTLRFLTSVSVVTVWVTNPIPTWN